MFDSETRQLDGKILEFIRRSADGPSSEAQFGSLAFRIFKYQFERNGNYRKFCEMEGKTPGVLRGWKEIPAMPTAGFKELILTTFPIRNAVKKFRTSGTTRVTRGVHLFDTLKLYEASVVPAFQNYLVPRGGDFSFFFLVASPEEATDSSLSHMTGVLNNRFAGGRGKYYVKQGALLCEALAGDLKKLKGPAVILATAFSLAAFLDFLRKKRISIKLRAGSRLMETGGFKGRAKEVTKSALYAACRKMLGLDRGLCVSEYGMTELSSQFYDTALKDAVLKIRRKPRKEGPAWIKAVIIDSGTEKDAAPGKAGLIRIFDLANRGSVMAVQTEDLGRAVAGGGFELLGRAGGSELRGCSLSYEEFLSG